jgi:hypothetical protein
VVVGGGGFMVGIGEDSVQVFVGHGEDSIVGGRL